jgi:hypothetical protein
MMFWIGFFIALVAGIIGIGLSREWVKRKFPRISEKHLDFVSLVILAIGLLISAIDYSEQSKTLGQLEYEQRGRFLTPKQKEYLKETFISLPKTKVYLIGIQGDREAIRFANTLKDVFIVAGWEVDGVWEDGLIGGAGPGILVRQGSSASDSLGQSITDALNQIQITSRFVITPDLKPHKLEIIVGSRP